MSSIGLVMNAGIRSNLRLKTTVFIMLPITIICAAGVALIFCLQMIAPAMKAPVPDTAALQNYLGLVVYISGFLGVGITLNSFGFQTLVREKARGNLQSLLATPLRPADIWLGKSLSIFLPGAVFGILMAVMALVIINAAYFLPDMGFLVTPAMLVTSIIAVPLIYLFLGLLVHLVGLTAKASSGNVIAQVFLPVMITLMINLLVRNVMDASSWLFTGVNFGLAVILGIVVFVLRARMTPERIILSG